MNDAFQADGVVDIMNVTLVPFGNARFSPSGNLTCQHGPEECTANSYEQCAIDAFPDFTTHFPFYLCMERAGEKMVKQAQKCAESAGLDYEKIKSCVDDPDKSMTLQKRFHELTPKDHKYTPWVVVNGKLSKSNGEKLLEEVCAAYTGTAPAGCTSLLHRKERRVCHADSVEAQ